jgi:hypothetical protein
MPNLLRSEWLDSARQFAFPDWETVAAHVDLIAPANSRETWNQLAREWMDLVCSEFTAPMQHAESTHFLLYLPKSNRHAANCLHQLEDYRVRIRQLLGPLALEKWESKCVVLIPPSSDDFVRYLIDYTEGDETPMPGGVYLNRGYGHFVFPDGELTYHTPIIAHELCHALLKSHDMPAWVNEGVTETIEHQITGQKPYFLDQEIIERHRAYWTLPRLHSFWRGESFSFADEGFELSYHLSRFLINALTQQGRAPFLQFVATASASDAGFSAAHDCLGIKLEEVVWDLLDLHNTRETENAF